MFDITKNILNPLALMPFCTGVVGLFCLLHFFPTARKNAFSALAVIFALGVILWQFSQGFMLNTLDARAGMFFGKIMFSAMVITAANIYLFSNVYAQKTKRQRFIIAFIYFIAIFCLVLIFRQFFFLPLPKLRVFGLYLKARPALYLIVGFVVLCFSLSFSNLISCYLREKDAAKKRRALGFMLFTLFVLLSFVDLFVAYEMPAYPYGFLFLLFAVGSLFCYEAGYCRDLVQEKIADCERQLARKSVEIFDMAEKLRNMQVGLIESGRASALASLSSGILHQISQPVTAIYGFVKYMKEEIKEDDKFYKPISLMEEQANELKNKLENLMQLVSHRKAAKDYINVNDVIKKAMGLLVDELKKRQVRWIAHLGKNVPYVFGDSVALQQVVMNLVMNAAQSLENTPTYYVRHFVITSEYQPEAKEVTVSIVDNGPGIDEANKAKIFEPFFTTKEKALGIGLPLCKSIVEEHLGHIDFVTEKDKETAFYVRLPAAEIAAAKDEKKD